MPISERALLFSYTCWTFQFQYSTTSSFFYSSRKYEHHYGNFFHEENPCFLFGRRFIFPSLQKVQKSITHLECNFLRLRLIFFRWVSIFGSEESPQRPPEGKFPPPRVPTWVRTPH